MILFQVLDKVLNLSKGVSDKLQSEDLDVVSGCDRVEDLLVAIEELRTEDKFKTFWNATVETCEELNIETPMEKRQRKIPVRLDDHPETAVPLEPKDTFRVGFYFSVSICANRLILSLPHCSKLSIRSVLNCRYL